MTFPKPNHPRKARRAMSKIGPRTRRRNKATAYLRRTVRSVFCELRRYGCTLYGTEWAHAKKSRKLVGADWETAARACRHCHNIIEAMQPGDMEQTVLEAIGKRVAQGTD